MHTEANTDTLTRTRAQNTRVHAHIRSLTLMLYICIHTDVGVLKLA